MLPEGWQGVDGAEMEVAGRQAKRPWRPKSLIAQETPEQFCLEESWAFMFQYWRAVEGWRAMGTSPLRHWLLKAKQPWQLKEIFPKSFRESALGSKHSAKWSLWESSEERQGPEAQEALAHARECVLSPKCKGKLLENLEGVASFMAQKRISLSVHPTRTSQQGKVGASVPQQIYKCPSQTLGVVHPRQNGNVTFKITKELPTYPSSRKKESRRESQSLDQDHFLARELVGVITHRAWVRGQSR